VEAPLALNSAYKTYLHSSDLNWGGVANRFVFLDVNPGSICTPGFGVEMTRDEFVHYPSAFHKGSGVIAYADTHVEARKWLDARTKKSLTSGADRIPHHDSSVGNKDLQWIRDRATVRK
jgi:hypothetical protein